MVRPNCYRILYAIGPGDVVRAFHDWRKSEITSSETSLTFSGQFFDFCRDSHIQCWAISSNDLVGYVDDGLIRVENRPKKPRGNLSGVRFHTRQLRYGLSILASALRFNADLVIVDSGTTHWFVLSAYRVFGLKIVNNFHNAIWPAGYPPNRLKDRLINFLDGLYLRWMSDASMGVSPECQRQAESIARTSLKFFQFRPQYLSNHFENRCEPDPTARPFRTVFAGRVERDKGVFDLIEIARLLEEIRPGEFVFEVCGDGSAYQELVSNVQSSGLVSTFIVHGLLKRQELVEIYGRCHLVIVPTTHECSEAFAMVAAEAILVGRPVLSSSVVPATEILKPAVVFARTGDVHDYADQIVKLADDHNRYRKLLTECERLRPIFFDRQNGFYEALSRAVKSVQAKHLT